MTNPGYTLFDTPIGRCAVAWSAVGIMALQLPERHEAATVARLRRRNPGLERREPPAPVRRAIKAIQRMLDGAGTELSDIVLDLGGLSPFQRRVYQAARAIPAGRTVSYGALAAQLGKPGAARAIGRAMGSNPVPIIVPCHRVLAAGGKAGGFSAHGGVATKFALLRAEGAAVEEGSGRV
jgi:methylated-DNA-[protein]-cysteine S-methyltransferase